MDVLRLPIRLYQLPVPRHMGKHAQLNLRIVRLAEHASLPCKKDFPNQPAKLHAHGNVLQVRVSAADAPRRRNRLVERAVNPPRPVNELHQPVRIRGL